MFFLSVSINSSTTIETTLAGSDNTIIYHSRKKLLLWANFLSKNEVINASVYWMDDITENFVTVCLLKVQSFFELICRKTTDGEWYMDEWIKLPKAR